MKKVDVKSHLYFYGIDLSYGKQFWHGEAPRSIGSSCKRARTKKVCNENKGNHLTDMINDVENRVIDSLDNKILEEAEPV